MRLQLEELGKNLGIALEVEIDFDVTPAEPQVRYFADGSGDPGCPASFEITNVRVLQYSNDSIVVKRSERPDWFAFLDDVAFNYCLDNERIEERIKDANIDMDE